MLDFMNLIAAFWRGLLDLLNTVRFQIGSVTVTLFGVMIGALLLGLVISTLWGGAKT